MEISFSTTQLQELFDDYSLLQRRFGSDVAKGARKCIAIMEAASNLKEIGCRRKMHPLDRGRSGEFSMLAANGRCVVFEPDHDPVPVLKAGGIDRQSITKVKIVFLGNYHD